MSQPASFLSISELTVLLNHTLEREVGVVRFEGEISQITRAKSGHIYATVKDAEACLAVAMWASSARSLGFTPIEGMSVQCEGRPSVYNKSGRLQIIVSRMQPAGEGLLKKKFLELRAKLEAEGLFAAERKRRLPFLPRAIGIVTSKDGAAVRDIDVILRARMPQIPKFMVPVQVQGKGSAEEIARGIYTLSESGLVDVMIVGRGGGSLEDLWSFNEEVVVRAIFASRVPVVSAVGHEVDITLSDLVADVRAPTPTAAAELVVPKRDDLLAFIDEYQRRLFDFERWLGPAEQLLDDLGMRLGRSVASLIDERRARLRAADAHLKLIEPRRLLSSLQERVQGMFLALRQSASSAMGEAKLRFEQLHSELRRCSPAPRLVLENEKCASLARRLSSAVSTNFNTESRRLENLRLRLEAASPQAILSRGFAMVSSKGQYVRHAGQVSIGDDLQIKLVDGEVAARVSK